MLAFASTIIHSPAEWVSPLLSFPNLAKLMKSDYASTCGKLTNVYKGKGISPEPLLRTDNGHCFLPEWSYYFLIN